MVQGEIRSIQPYLNAMAKEIGTEKKNVTQYNQSKLTK